MSMKENIRHVAISFIAYVVIVFVVLYFGRDSKFYYLQDGFKIERATGDIYRGDKKPGK